MERILVVLEGHEERISPASLLTLARGEKIAQTIGGELMGVAHEGEVSERDLLGRGGLLMEMKDAGTVVAVNTDPSAPIFTISALRIIGGLRETTPALTERVRQWKTRESAPGANTAP